MYVPCQLMLRTSEGMHFLHYTHPSMYCLVLGYQSVYKLYL